MMSSREESRLTTDSDDKNINHQMNRGQNCMHILYCAYGWIIIVHAVESDSTRERDNMVYDVKSRGK